MAELLAIGKDLKNMALTPALNADGSASLKLSGDGYKPELRLNQAEAAAVVKTLSATPVELPHKEEPPVESGKVVWYGDFSSGKIDPILFPYTSAVPGHATVVNDPLGSGQKVLELVVAETDRPYAGDENPRADIFSRHLFIPGDDYYIGLQTKFDPSMPLINTGWLQWFEFYGKPYAGSAPIPGGVWNEGGKNCVLLQTAQYKPGSIQMLWVGPPIDAQWHNYIFHVKFATDDTGFIELWYDGVQQTFKTGGTKVNFPNMTAINWDGHTPNFLNINNYRGAGGSLPGTVTIYHGSPVVATTLSAAQKMLTL
jgi:hypothetical protein